MTKNKEKAEKLNAKLYGNQEDEEEEETAWPSGLGRWCCNPDVPGSTPPPCH